MESHCQVSDILAEMAHAEGAAPAAEPATCGNHASLFAQTRPGTGAHPDTGNWKRLNYCILIFSTAVFTKHTISDQAGC